MIHRMLFFWAALEISLNAFAQATQPCIVKQYNQKLTKTPLPGVQVEVRDAGSATSSANGTLTLKFTTLKPGDRVMLCSVKKTGFEIFNKTAIEQWNISRNQQVFEIILVRSKFFAQLKSKLTKSSTDNYKNKYEKAKAELAKLQQDGKLKEQEYRQHLKDLDDQYVNALKNLNNYIDQFARIDLSEVSAEEQRILNLVEEGKIDEAVKAYEALNISGKLQQARENKKALTKAKASIEEEEVKQEQIIKDLKEKQKREISTLKLAGGKENYDKVARMLKENALADTTDVDAVWAYAEFANVQHDFNEAELFYQICLRHVNDEIYKKMAIFHNMAVLYTSNKNYDKASKAYSDALFLLQKSDNSYHALTMAASILLNYGSMCLDQHNFESAENFFLLGLQNYMKLDSITQGAFQFYIGRVYHNLGHLYELRHLNQDDFEKAERYYLQSLVIKERLFQENGEKNNKYREDVSYTQNNLGLLYLKMKQYMQAEQYLQKALDNNEYLCQLNNQAWQSDLAKTKMNLGILYKETNKNDKSLKYFNESLQIWDSLYSHFKDVYRPELTETLYNMGIACMETGKLEDAEHLFLRLLNINTEDIEWSIILSSPLILPMHKEILAKSQYCLMLIYSRNPEQIDKYRKYLGYALNNFKQILDDNPSNKTFYAELKIREAYGYVIDRKRDEAEACLNVAYEMDHINTAASMAFCLNGLAGLYVNANDFQKALETIDHAIAFMPQEANYYDTKGEILLMKGDEQEAVKMWQKVIELEPDFLSKHDGETPFYKQLKEKGLVK